jgi:hypothetical protein
MMIEISKDEMTLITSSYFYVMYLNFLSFGFIDHKFEVKIQP